MSLKGYADLFHLHEDARIEIIGQKAEQGERVGFFVDDDAKADRYIKKLTERFRVEVAERKSDSVAGTTFVKVIRRTDA
jgi:hypothetical protein